MTKDELEFMAKNRDFLFEVSKVIKKKDEEIELLIKKHRLNAIKELSEYPMVFSITNGYEMPKRVVDILTYDDAPFDY